MKNKVNVRMDRQEISDEELMHFKDFDLLLKEHQRLQSGKIKLWKIIVSAILICGVLFYVLMNSDQTNSSDRSLSIPQDSNQDQRIETLKQDASLSIEKKLIVTTEKKKEQKVLQEQKKNSIVAEQEIPQTQVPDSASLSKPVTVEVPAVKQPEAVYVKAEPVNGYEALYAYFGKELIYPKEAVKDSIQGVLTVTFLINKEGRPEKIKISGALGAAFDKEAVRLVESMPAWKPATINGQPVVSKLSLPLTFQLRKNK